jgi:hypothetical protein
MPDLGDVFQNEPALRLVWDLADRGIDLQVSDDGTTLEVTPAEALRATDLEQLRAHKPTVLVIVGCCDAGVLARVREFRQQPDTDAPVLVPGIRYTTKRCWSCLARVARPGRCWCCRLAYRLARRLPLTEEVMTPTPDPSPVPVQRPVPVPVPKPAHEPEPVHVHDPDPDPEPVPETDCPVPESAA